MKKKEIDPIDVILDDENDDNIVLYNEDEPLEFQQVCVVEFEKKQYCMLRPVEQLEDIKDNQALVFSIECEKNGNKFLQIINDDNLLDKIFKMYYDKLDECYDRIENSQKWIDTILDDNNSDNIFINKKEYEQVLFVELKGVGYSILRLINPSEEEGELHIFYINQEADGTKDFKLLTDKHKRKKIFKIYFHNLKKSCNQILKTMKQLDAEEK